VNEQAPRAEHVIIRLARQFSRFFSVGLVAVGVHYGVMILLVEAFRLDEVHAAVIGYTIGGFASYSLNRKFTYDTERSHGAAAWRFAVVAGIGLVITWVFMALFNRYLGWHYVLSQLITTAIVMMWSFFAHKYWTFVDPS
jgi:putative flippase GtrA